MDFQEILEMAKDYLSCPVCGEQFDSSQIHFRGFIDDKFVIQTDCSNGHSPISALFISSVNFDGRPLHVNDSQITANEVLDLHNKLAKFDGDFETLFKRNKANGTLQN